MYYDDLKKTKPLSRAREKHLLKLAKHGNLKARNEILESNLKFVFDIAKKYTGRGVAISELISEGNMGLIYSIDKFDETKDVKFISYAVWWIRYSIIEAIKNKKQRSSVEVCEDDIMNKKFSTGATDDDESVTYMEASFSDALDSSNKEKRIKQNKVVRNLMEGLSEREAEIIVSYYGLNGADKMNLVEIGEMIGITSERVRQIKKNTLKKLRSKILMMDEEELLT